MKANVLVVPGLWHTLELRLVPLFCFLKVFISQSLDSSPFYKSPKEKQTLYAPQLVSQWGGDPQVCVLLPKQIPPAWAPCLRQDGGTQHTCVCVCVRREGKMEGEQKQQIRCGAGPGSLPRAAAAHGPGWGGGSPH